MSDFDSPGGGSAPNQPTQPAAPTQPIPPGGYLPPDAYQAGTYPPPNAVPPIGYPPAGAWPQPGAAWPNQAPGYTPQQPDYPPQQPGHPTAAYAPTPVTGKPRRAGLAILLGVLGLCVLLVVGGLLLLNPRTTTTSPPVPTSRATSSGRATSTATAAATTQTTTSAPSAPSAPDAVKGYLDALAAGDADAALSYAATLPADSSLLTGEVLAAGNAIAPITDVEVDPSTATGTADVRAHYTIGSEEVDADFGVVETTDGWKLSQVAAKVAVDRFPAVATINGSTAAYSATLTLFPGSYRIAAGDSRYVVSGGDFVIESLTDSPSVKVTAKLSSTGVAAVRSAAQKRLNACIKENKLHPSDGCGFWILAEDQNGKKFKPKKVRWRITSGASTLKTVKLTVNQSDAAIVTGKTKVKLYLRTDATNGRWYWANVTISSLRAILRDGSIEVRFNE